MECVKFNQSWPLQYIRSMVEYEVLGREAYTPGSRVLCLVVYNDRGERTLVHPDHVVETIEGGPW